MRILYYDCFAGISGDMHLSALLDLGVPEEYLKSELAKLGLAEEYEFLLYRDERGGICGNRLEIRSKGQTEKKIQRNYPEITDIILNSTLTKQVKDLSLGMFIRLAESEAKIHGAAIEEVHFHEVGAIDSIIDIVGAAICLDYLKPDLIWSSKVELGGGSVECAHGLLPVPTPAVLELLKGVPVTIGKVMKEMTTPTGAVILAENVDAFVDKADIILEKVGYGLGNRKLEIPNVLRVLLGSAGEYAAEKTMGELRSENNFMIEVNIDDMNPEYYQHVEERLFSLGALDVFKTPIIMKKGRPAVKLSLLVKEKDIKGITDIIFRETTAIGLRKYPIDKLMLERYSEEINTSFGPVRVKFSKYKGEVIKYKPEFEDCRKIACLNNIPLNKIQAEVNRIIENRNV